MHISTTKALLGITVDNDNLDWLRAFRCSGVWLATLLFFNQVANDYIIVFQNTWYETWEDVRGQPLDNIIYLTLICFTKKSSRFCTTFFFLSTIALKISTTQHPQTGPTYCKNLIHRKVFEMFNLVWHLNRHTTPCTHKSTCLLMALNVQIQHNLVIYWIWAWSLLLVLALAGSRLGMGRGEIHE